MYSVDRKSGRLTLLADVKSPRENDAPRHAIASPDGKLLYCVTEHSEVYHGFLYHVLILPLHSELRRCLQRD
jgi:carboxy-cis,cis-muconate cyclase